MIRQTSGDGARDDAHRVEHCARASWPRCARVACVCATRFYRRARDPHFPRCTAAAARFARTSCLFLTSLVVRDIVATTSFACELRCHLSGIYLTASARATSCRSRVRFLTSTSRDMARTTSCACGQNGGISRATSSFYARSDRAAKRTGTRAAAPSWCMVRVSFCLNARKRRGAVWAAFLNAGAHQRRVRTVAR